MKLKKAASALAISGVLALGAGQAVSAETIKVGTFLAVTGGASFLGDP
ncbi:MAG: ABC transporter substrate-binding protein, partial [Sedimenticola selenatireducens]